jgi:8-oxo-dGTP pyrophosphatase MutT (NUDIX family)
MVPDRPPRTVRRHEVAAGIIWDGARVLIARRQDGDHQGGRWEFPGGKRHDRETIEDCLRREMREEIGIDVEVGRLWRALTHVYPDRTVSLTSISAALAPERRAPSSAPRSDGSTPRICTSFRSSRETSRSCPTSFVISSPEPFEIEGADGGPLRGDLYAAALAGPRAVLLCHGFRGYKDWGFIPLLASTIAAQGTPVAAFNMSGSGFAGPDGAFIERERFRKNTYAAELDDIHRVARWLRRRLDSDDLALGLMGHSRGGAMALLYAASHPEVRTVVSLAAPSRIGVWPEAAFEAWRDHRPHIVRDFRTRA